LYSPSERTRGSIRSRSGSIYEFERGAYLNHSGILQKGKE
jgi:hypothetical protein